MRVYDLARTLDMKSKDLITQMRKMNIQVKTASSSVDDRDVQRVMTHYRHQPQQGAGGGATDDMSAEIERVRNEAQSRKDEEKKRLEASLDAARRRIDNLRHGRPADHGAPAQPAASPEPRPSAPSSTATAVADAPKPASRPAGSVSEEERKKIAERLIRKAKGLPLEDQPKAPPAPAPGSGAGQAPAANRGDGAGKFETLRVAPKPKTVEAPPPLRRAEKPAPQERRPPQDAPPQQRPKPADDDRKPRRGKKGGKDQSGEPLKMPPTIEVMKMDERGGGRRRGGGGGGDKRRGKVRPTKVVAPGEAVGFDKMSSGTGPVRGNKRRRGGGGGGPQRQAVATKQLEPRKVSIQGAVTVGEFADRSGVSLNDVMKQLMMQGEMATINDVLPDETMELIALELGLELTIVPDTDENDIAELLIEDDPGKMEMRPPIVTVMGHVDHGKTSLMDAFRESNVVDGEVGGITQAIGAYSVSTTHGKITFIDTPGHAAFTAMRARGAQVTDVVVLVVAADDSVMPQTIEAINHAKSANVPIIVAVNKVDLEDSNPDRVINDLSAHGIVPEDWGGDNIFVQVSAKTKLNVPELMDQIALQSEVLDLKADPNRVAEGTIIEAHVDPLRGSVATVLIQKGTLKVGDIFVCGDVYGRVRRMRDETDTLVKEAGPSKPVELIGLNGSPAAGEQFLVVKDERTARDIAQKRTLRRRNQNLKTIKRVTLDNLHEHLEEGKVRELNMIIKGDLQGSIEAIKDSLNKIPQDQVKINIVHSAVGAISESDISLAVATESIVIGFNVRAETIAQQAAQVDGVEIRTYRIIYQLIEEIEQAMVGMLEPKFKEEFRGRADVLQVFKITKVGAIAGCLVVEGEVTRDSHARLIRDDTMVWEGKVQSVRRVKDDVKQVNAGTECGIQLLDFQDIKEGDTIECFNKIQVQQTL